jgi:hypothetical protein
MDSLIGLLQRVMDYLKGWLEIVTYKVTDYKYVIENIENSYFESNSSTMIRYKVAGSRVLITESAINLNKTALFSSFKPEHAQMIVSIATVEKLLDLSPQEIKQKYLDYINLCSLKINKQKRV